MYDPTFGYNALNHHVSKSDIRKYPAIAAPETRTEIIQEAVKLAHCSHARFPLNANVIARSTVYRLIDLPSELISRKAAQNIRVISNAKQANRLEIVRRLALLLSEGIPFTVARFDIQSFYESIDHGFLKEILRLRFRTAPGTRLVLRNFVDQCEEQCISGLPRGIAISAALSELYLQDFDDRIRRDFNTYIYARYVDDVILVMESTDRLCAFRKAVVRMLPRGLNLNAQKTKLMTFGGIRASSPKLEHQFDYLGFSFDVYQIKRDKLHTRKVIIDIAESKIKKIKTRIVRSLIQYLKDGNYEDLEDRFKLITCNYCFYDFRNDRRRFAGLYHTYALISTPSGALSELDQFLPRVLLSKTGKVSGPLAHRLSRSQRRRLLSLSFTRAFRKGIHFYFSPDRLNHLIKCWKYE